MKEIVASRIIRLMMPLFLESPNRSKSLKGLSSRLILKPGTSESRPRRSCRITSNWGQCRRKCSLSSKSLPQAQNGVRLSKLCLNLCSFSILNFKRNFVSNLTPSISEIWFKTKKFGFVYKIAVDTDGPPYTSHKSGAHITPLV